MNLYPCLSHFLAGLGEIRYKICAHHSAVRLCVSWKSVHGSSYFFVWVHMKLHGRVLSRTRVAFCQKITPCYTICNFVAAKLLASVRPLRLCDLPPGQFTPCTYWVQYKPYIPETRCPLILEICMSCHSYFEWRCVITLAWILGHVGTTDSEVLL